MINENNRLGLIATVILDDMTSLTPPSLMFGENLFPEKTLQCFEPEKCLNNYFHAEGGTLGPPQDKITAVCSNLKKS